MKKLLLSSAFLMATFITNAQAMQDWTSGLPPITNYNNHTIATDSQGNVYAVGNYDGVSRDFDPGVGVFTMSSASNNMYIIKFNSAGNFVWAKQIGGSGSLSITAADSIFIDASDNIYISGMSYGISGGIDFDPGIGVVNVTNTASGGGYVMYILKLDANGNHLMNKQFKDGTNDSRNHINAMKVDAFGNIYATGCFGGTLDFDPDSGTTNLTQSGTYAYSNNIFILKLNSTGSLIWAKGLLNTGVGGNNVTDEGYGIDVDSAGNVYTVGYYWFGIDADPGAGVHNLVAYTSSNPTITGSNTQYISKLDASGNFVWAYDLLGDHSLNVLPSLKVDNSNNIIISGYNQQSSIPDYDFTTGIYTLPNDTSAFILKINANAGLIWAKSAARETVVNASHGSFSPGLALDVAGNIYTTGSFGYYGAVDFDPSTANNILSSTAGGSNNDGYISKLDTNGNLVWVNKVGGTGNDYCFSIAVSPLGKVTVSGKTDTGFSRTVAAVSAGGFLASFSQPALATSQFDLDKNISVYPNPTVDLLNVSYSDPISRVEMFNILGQQILSVENSTNEIQINMAHYASGTYLIKVYSAEMFKTIKIIKK